ncbi:MAG: FmdB family transcriptional regulator [Mycobacteriaceae bacterium]|nr:FmdB family transcriptional regulator [Mycobacteriaceae bacterium]
MPTYSYTCTDCDHRFDIVQAFTDDALTTCQKCSGRLRKLFNSVGVVFKGSGFYRTDSREAAKSSASSSTTASSTEKKSSNESKSSGETKVTSEKTSSTEKTTSGSTAA